MGAREGIPLRHLALKIADVLASLETMPGTPGVIKGSLVSALQGLDIAAVEAETKPPTPKPPTIP